MGLLDNLIGPLARHAAELPIALLVVVSLTTVLALVVLLNVVKQLLLRNPNEPPVVFHWFPVIGNAVSYGMDPYKFFFNCREKYGDIFTFVLLGKKTTVFLGIKGNEFILNAKLKDVNAEEIYAPLTTPVFGSGVVYDCPNSVLMEQKKFVKFGLSTEAFQAYVPLIVGEVEDFLNTSKHFQGDRGICNLPKAMAELTIYTASVTLQGKEVREKFDSSFADLYHDLDMGFTPINFMLPWAPLPQNRRRDIANQKMSKTYLDIIKKRRETVTEKDSEDMIWNLMSSVYKNGSPISDIEVAHMMIALLMAGQHSSSSTSSWILLRLAQHPELLEELLQEQKRVLGGDLPPLTYENIKLLTLNSQVVKETLRIHSPIHSILRQVKSPMPIEGTNFTVPPSHVLLAAPGVTSRSSQYFENPTSWDPHRWDDAKKVAQFMKDDEDDETVDYGYGLVSKGTNSPYLPFGAGRHRCIGEQFAYLQLGTIVATVVRLLKLRNPPNRTEFVATDYSSLFSRPMGPANVEWEKRSKKEA